MTATKEPSKKTISALKKQWRALLIQLKKGIDDDYRCSDDSDDKTPGMCVTFGATLTDDGFINWNYQTGDNSFTGGAYSHKDWALVYLYRKSDCTSLASDAVEEVLDLMAQ